MPENGQVIRIGDTCFRFRLEPADDSTAELPAVADPNGEPPGRGRTAARSSHRRSGGRRAFHGAATRRTDGCLRLHGRVARETTPRGLVGLALNTIQEQTAATVCGFLSLDEDDPLPKMVLPDPDK